MRSATLELHLTEAAPALEALRGIGACVLFDPDTFAMLHKPKVLPPEVKELVDEHRLALVRLLVPWSNGHAPRSRPGWTPGALDVCFCCDQQWPQSQSTHLRDPLGWARHVSCGWFVPDRRQIQSSTNVPSYPYKLSG